jgi:hypothetical protein
VSFAPLTRARHVPGASPQYEAAPKSNTQANLVSWKDGTRAVVLELDDLMVRLCAAVPPPRFHLVRYFGVLSSHSRLRKHVVPEPPDDPSAHVPLPAPGDQLELELDDPGDAPTPPRKR